MIYLASCSPRRRDLLGQLGVNFRTLDTHIDESPLAGETPRALALRLAQAKADAGRQMLADGDAHLVLGADTIVVLDDQVLGKPRDPTHAVAMLGQLSERCHRVLSAVALAGAARSEARLSESRVCFRKLSHQECQAYADSGEPLDKAGSYAIQGRAAAFVSDLQGSYSGVVGMPLYETAQLLTAAGVRLFPR